MPDDQVPHPPVTNREQWRAQRVALLEAEKELTRHRDRVNASRRRLPMVRLDKTYTFTGPEGELSLVDLFEGRRQLIVYHFMFDPSWDKGCTGCTGFVDALGDLSMLAERDTSFALISRAPIEKLEAYKAERGWTRRWVSSFGGEFNYDFHATLDADKAPYEYNYVTGEEKLKAKREKDGADAKLFKGESHGISVFFRLGDDVHHTYSNFARACENCTDTYSLLDLTPYGRQEDFEESPEGWPQKPTYG